VCSRELLYPGIIRAEAGAAAGGAERVRDAVGWRTWRNSGVVAAAHAETALRHRFGIELAGAKCKLPESRSKTKLPYAPLGGWRPHGSLNLNGAALAL
jgi:hypothetical protein